MLKQFLVFVLYKEKWSYVVRWIPQVKLNLVDPVIPREVGVLPVRFRYTLPVIMQRSKWWKKRLTRLTDMTSRDNTWHRKLIFMPTARTFQAQTWTTGQFSSGKIPAAELCQKAGVDMPVATGLVHCYLSTLKALVKWQVMAHCVLPAQSVLCKLGVAVLDEAVDLS